MFSEIVYRGYGPHQRKGGGFSTRGVNSEEALAAALADGWYKTLPEAIEAHDKLVAPAATGGAPAIAPVAATASAEHPATSTPDDNSPPTRAELEQKATELGIKFNPRIGDKKLAERIAAAL